MDERLALVRSRRHLARECVFETLNDRGLATAILSYDQCQRTRECQFLQIKEIVEIAGTFVLIRTTHLFVLLVSSEGANTANRELADR